MHKTKNVIINCIDFRIQESFYHWLENTHRLGKSDIIEIAGSTRDLVKPINPKDKEELIRNIEISVDLHSPDTIILIDHQDCGGYAQDKTIESGLEKDEDIKEHKKYINQAKEILAKIFKDKNILTYYIALDGEVIEI